MPPAIKCPNCEQDEWLESPDLGYIPKLVVLDDDDGQYATDTENGIHLRVWRCNNCMYVMPFWEPD